VQEPHDLRTEVTTVKARMGRTPRISIECKA
jgi:hypothetical protein